MKLVLLIACIVLVGCLVLVIATERIATPDKPIDLGPVEIRRPS